MKDLIDIRDIKSAPYPTIVNAIQRRLYAGIHLPRVRPQWRHMGTKVTKEHTCHIWHVSYQIKADAVYGGTRRTMAIYTRGKHIEHIYLLPTN